MPVHFLILWTRSRLMSMSLLFRRWWHGCTLVATNSINLTALERAMRCTREERRSISEWNANFMTVFLLRSNFLEELKSWDQVLETLDFMYGSLNSTRAWQEETSWSWNVADQTFFNFWNRKKKKKVEEKERKKGEKRKEWEARRKRHRWSGRSVHGKWHGSSALIFLKKLQSWQEMLSAKVLTRAAQLQQWGECLGFSRPLNKTSLREDMAGSRAEHKEKELTA